MNQFKNVYIYQPRFLGDVLFVMAIAQKYLRSGHKVIFPVEDSYLTGASIEKNFPGIEFISIDNFREFEFPKQPGIHEYLDKIIINLSDTSNYLEHMGQKYRQLNLPIAYWRNVKIERDKISEEKLLAILDIHENEKFNLINEFYSNKKTFHMTTQIQNNYKNVFLKKIDGFNLFDWMGVIERAATIHTVHTSIQYIMDIMPNITEELHIYPRVEVYEPHSYYNYLFIKNYQYHGYPRNISYLLNFKIRQAKRFWQKRVANKSFLTR
jgi:hypothetical protein